MDTMRGQIAQARRALRSRRTVWAALTRHPRASLDELVNLAGMPRSTVHDALYALRAAGHIDFVDGAKRARTVQVPFLVIKKDHTNGHR